MSLHDLLRSLRALAANRVRTALTLLGMMIGAGSIVLLACLMRGGEEALVATNQQATESDIIKAHPEDPPAEQRMKTRRDFSAADAETLSESRLLEGSAVERESFKQTQGFYRGNKKRVRLVAASPNAPKLYRLTLARGRLLDEDDARTRRRVCVVGHEIWKELLGEPRALDGITISAADVRWSVVGILQDKPYLGASDGTNVWNRKILVPQTTFDATFRPRHDADTIYVRVAGGERAVADRFSAFSAIIRGTILRRHLGVLDFKVDDTENRGQEKLILDVIKMLILATGALALVVGGINIMNIMLVTVTERTREIGVRRAVGATPGVVLRQFLLEAAVIALIGGAMGVVGGLGASWGATLALRKLVGGWTMHVEAWAIAAGLGLSLVTGVVFGIFPAWRASRLDVVEALRAE